MGFKSVCFLVFLLNGALSEDSLVHPCSKDDVACLSESAREFLERTCAGIKDFDIKPIDPWFSPEVQLPAADGVSVLLKNVSVIGLKNIKINNFKIDSVKKTVVLGMKDDAEILADIVVERSGQKVSGTISSKQSIPETHGKSKREKVISIYKDDKKGTAVNNYSATSFWFNYTQKPSCSSVKVELYYYSSIIDKLMTAKYTYDLVPDAKGVEYFHIGPETFICDLEGKPSLEISEDVAKVLWRDIATAGESQKKFICNIVEPAYTDVIHNVRASTKIYPKTTYFTDL